MKERLERFMQGRYGIDAFSTFLVLIALVLFIVGMFVPFSSVRIIMNSWALLLGIYAYWRIFSKNHGGRYRENENYIRLFYPVRRFFYRIKNKIKDRKYHRIYKCPSCKQAIRVPKGKGKIAITCPKCRTEFIKRS